MSQYARYTMTRFLEMAGIAKLAITACVIFVAVWG